VGYDPNKSRVSANSMQHYLDNEVSGELLDVPGIGPAAAERLKNSEDRITNQWMLFGKYLMLKGPDEEEEGVLKEVSILDHNERFWHYLKDTGINAHRSAIVRAIAEKSSQFFTGIYDAQLYAP
jgi:hypothetical protein